MRLALPGMFCNVDNGKNSYLPRVTGESDMDFNRPVWGPLAWMFFWMLLLDGCKCECMMELGVVVA
jgi:hypothetical protein